MRASPRGPPWGRYRPASLLGSRSSAPFLLEFLLCLLVVLCASGSGGAASRHDVPYASTPSQVACYQSMGANSSALIPCGRQKPSSQNGRDAHMTGRLASAGSTPSAA